jgi:hypothetical protein
VLPREALRFPSPGQLVSNGGGTCGGNWTDSFIRWELESRDLTTNLVLLHNIPATGRVKRVRLDDTLAGWHNHLDVLGSVLSTKPGARQAGWQWGRHEQLREQYAAVVGS